MISQNCTCNYVNVCYIIRWFPGGSCRIEKLVEEDQTGKNMNAAGGPNPADDDDDPDKPKPYVSAAAAAIMTSSYLYNRWFCITFK